MTESASQPAAKLPAGNIRGAIDLSSLQNRPATNSAAGAAGGESGSALGFAVDATEQSFPELVQISTDVPVVVAMFASWSPQSQSVVATLERLVASYAGKILLGRADIETFPQLAQAFGTQGVPAVVALVKGQPVPLFNGDISDSDARRYLDELLKVAAANGVNGSLGDPAAEPEEAPLPPLHQEAITAIDDGDLDAAEAAYRRALAEAPADRDAKVGLAQVLLMQRTDGLDTAGADQLRSAAADNPDDVAAQLAVADLDMVGGHVQDALDRVVGFISKHPGTTWESQREQARLRVLDLFDIVGVSDPRVAKARQALARALF